MQATFEEIGTTVTTPCPRRVAVALAASLLTTTAGRVFVARDPRAGSSLTTTMSPRRYYQGSYGVATIRRGDG
jgi:hypothetical protein